jgi:hypothetical protein
MQAHEFQNILKTRQILVPSPAEEEFCVFNVTSKSVIFIPIVQNVI